MLVGDYSNTGNICGRDRTRKAVNAGDNKGRLLRSRPHTRVTSRHLIGKPSVRRGRRVAMASAGNTGKLDLCS
jgi:hypothetical protein